MIEAHSGDLCNSYTAIREIWDQTLQDRSSNRPVDPWVDDSQDEFAPLTDLEQLWTMAYLQVNLTALSVKSHLESLASMYAASAIADWPFHSAFTLCRGVLEGSALVVWLGAPEIDGIERARRVTRLLAWSDHYAEQAGEPSIEYRNLAKGAGLVVTEGLGIPKVDGERFGQVKVIKTAFPNGGQDLYNLWSGYAHHAPWRLAPSTVGEFAENGVVSKRRSMVAQHHQACADTARLVSAASAAWDEIFLRSTDRSSALLTIADAARRRAEADEPRVE